MPDTIEIKQILSSVNDHLSKIQETNNDREKEIKKLGEADYLTEQKLKKMNEALDEKEKAYEQLDREIKNAKYKQEEAEKQFEVLKNELVQIKSNGIPKHGKDPQTKGSFDIAAFLKGYLNGDKSQRYRDYELENIKVPGEDGKYSRSLKAVLDETGSSGGRYLIPEEFSRDMIPMLYDNMVFGNLPVRRYTPKAGTINFPKMSSGATAYWIGENTAVTPSSAVFAQVPLAPLKLGVLTAVSNAMVLRSDPAVSQIVQQDMVKTAALACELAYLNGAGSSTEPQGIYGTGSLQSVTMGATGAKFSAANNIDKLMELIRKVEIAKGTFEAFVMHPQVKWDLRVVKTSQGNYILTAANNAGEPPSLLGYPYYTCSQVPTNVTHGGTPNTSWILGGQWSNVVIANWRDMTMQVSKEASYVSGGTTYSAFQNDLTLFVLFLETNIMIRQAATMGKIIGIVAETA